MAIELNAASRILAADAPKDLQRLKLAVMAGIAEGGNIKLKSTDSRGATFIVTGQLCYTAHFLAGLTKLLTHIGSGDGTFTLTALAANKIEVAFDNLVAKPTTASTKVVAGHPGDKYMSAFRLDDESDDNDAEPKLADQDFLKELFDLVVKNGNEVTILRSDVCLIAVKNGKPLLAADVEMEEVYLPAK